MLKPLDEGLSRWGPSSYTLEFSGFLIKIAEPPGASQTYLIRICRSGAWESYSSSTSWSCECTLKIWGPLLEEVGHCTTGIEEMWQSPWEGTQGTGATYLASVKVLDDGEVQMLLALPFRLHGVGQNSRRGRSDHSSSSRYNNSVRCAASER